MKKVFYPLACCLAAGVLVSCGGQKKAGTAQEEQSASIVIFKIIKSGRDGQPAIAGRCGWLHHHL